MALTSTRTRSTTTASHDAAADPDLAQKADAGAGADANANAGRAERRRGRRRGAVADYGAPGGWEDFAHGGVAVHFEQRGGVETQRGVDFEMRGDVVVRPARRYLLILVFAEGCTGKWERGRVADLCCQQERIPNIYDQEREWLAAGAHAGVRVGA
jgi:hypothetical protein